MAREVMKTHILSNSKDCFAVVLYGTVRGKLSEIPIHFQDKCPCQSVSVLCSADTLG